jgi:shikimate kinase
VVARIVLVGLPGVGKSSVARELAATWNCDSVDTDDLIAERVSMPASQYLRENGEAAFREAELGALEAALLLDAVIATGAGIVTTSEARRLLKSSHVIWLETDNETLLARVIDGDRPLLGNDHRIGLEKLRRDREHWYQEVADEIVDGSGSIGDVVQRILEKVDRTAS